ncbi:MAG: cell division protein FtsA, partial [Mucinivorans sp.]
LTGGGALLKNLDVLFKTQMGIDVRMAVPTVALTPESAEMVANPKYSTIVGMIVEALREGLYTHTEVRAMEPVEVPVESVAAEPHAAAWPRESYTPRATTSAASMAPAQQQDVPLSQQDSYDENSQQEYYSQEDEYQEEPEPYTVDKTQKKGIKLRFKELISKMFEPEEVEDDDNY